MAEAQEVQQETQEVQQEPVIITIQDLDAATKIIGAFIERGAVKAVEAEDVGRIWKKIAAFVQQAAAAQEQGESQEAGE
jgi:hypothetical protein